MRVSKTTKLVVDILLTTILFALIYPRQTGFTFHETAGLVMGIMVLIHAGCNWSWIKSISHNIGNPRLKSKSKLFYLLDWIAFLMIGALLTTGIMISMVLFPASGPISHSTVVLHKWLAYSSLVILGLHILLHWQFIVETAPRLWAAVQPVRSKAVLGLTSVVLILALVYYQSVFTLTDSPSAIAATQQASGEIGNTIRPPDKDETETGHGKGRGRGTASKNTSKQVELTASIPANQTLTDDGQDQTASIKAPTSLLSAGDANPDSSADAPMSLTDYLSNLFCSGCDKHCPLLALECERGEKYLQAAQQQYAAIYGSTTLD